jgi:hypothetical protein
MQPKYGTGSTPPRTKQEIAANECPMRCGKESAILVARPPQGSVATWWSRCQRCLAYWETSPAGKVTARRTVLNTDLCPDCLEAMTLTTPHLCTKK